MTTLAVKPAVAKPSLLQRLPWERYFSSFLTYSILIVLSAIFLLPFYIIVRNALSARADITSFNWVWFPNPTHPENFAALFNDKTAPMLSGLANSAIIATLQVIGQLALASMSGYGLARIPYRWRNIVFYFILVTLMIPSAVTFIPTFVLVAGLGWVNTLQGIIVPGLFNVFAMFVFRQFYLDFPRALEEAGRVDGLGYWGIFYRIVVPNSRGVFVSLGVIAFISSWNAFLWPLVIGQSASTWTVQIVLSTFLTAQRINLPVLFMGAAVSIAPVLVLFFILQRYIVEGVKFSGIKG
jgi:multiple sugar transport system permease protein